MRRGSRLIPSGHGPGAGATASQHAAGRARKPVHGPPWDIRQSPRSLRNLLVYSSGVVPETELQVGDAYESEQGVSRSSDQKCSPARPLPAAYDVSVFTSAM